MNIKRKIFLLSALSVFAGHSQERLIIVNEGLWQSDNGRLTYFEDGKIVSNEWFREVNGYKLGDTPNDIIRINDELIAISVNWSNIVQFITHEGRAVAATEDVPNNRKLATDGDFLYVSSYGHEVAVNNEYREFTKGFVAKIDISDFKVKEAVEVGYEPEGIAYYDGYLFVANTGGYAFQENHEYETTVSIIDAETMQVVRSVDTGQINLYGKMSQSGQYLCINSPGDYYDTMAATIIFDCRAAIEGKPDEECFISLEYAATYNTVALDGSFYAIGSRYSYYTGGYEFNYVNIDPFLLFESEGSEGVTNDFPGTIKSDIATMTMPYGIYVNPYTGYFYATDSGEFTGSGSLFQWNPEGELISKNKTYINPAHFLSLAPESNPGTTGIDCTDNPPHDSIFYNLLGLPVDHPQKGNIYIKNGIKIIY